MKEILKNDIKKPFELSGKQTPNKPGKKQKIYHEDVKLLNQRLDSHSRRINKLQNKLAQIISNQRHYLKLRLPDVLKKEKSRANFRYELDHARQLLKSLDKQRFTFLSNSKDKEKREQRYIGMFTHVEMTRLRRLLDVDHSIDYILYRKDNYERLKDKHVMFLNEGEIRRLRYLLDKKSLDKVKKSDIINN